MVQHSILLKSGNTDVMSRVDHVVMFYLMIKRRINLLRLILVFIITIVRAEKRNMQALHMACF